MARSYLRLDPDFAERKRAYPDGPYRALVDVLCAAEYEPKRGQFRNMAILRAVIGRSARHLPYLFAKGDISLSPDDRIDVVGWDEWQEGNWQVAERMRRVRARREGLVTVPTVTTALQAPDVPTVMVSSEAVSGKRLAVSGLAAANGAHADSDPYDEAVRWLASRNAWVNSPKIQTELARLVDRKGLEVVIGAMAAVPGAEDAAQFVYGARNALYPLAGSQTAKPPDDSAERFNRGVERTQRELARVRGETA